MAFPVYGFRDRSIAERLRDQSAELDNQPRPGVIGAPSRPSIGQQRTYWVVPKDTIPAATDDLTPGIGIGIIYRLNKDIDPPKLEKFQVDATDIEVTVYNYSPAFITRQGDDSPLVRVAEDVFGDLAVVTQGEAAALVQAPEGGISPRTLASVGSTVCDVVIVAPKVGPNYAAGDLVKTGRTIEILNWTFELAANEGDRIAQVSGHFDGALLVGWLCDNEADPDGIKVYVPDYVPP